MKILKLLCLLFLLAVLAGSAYYLFYPDLAKLKKQNPGKTALMEYRELEWKANGKKVRIKRSWVGFSAISPYLVKAVIIAEDDKFWSHKGFDFEAIEKALEKDLKEGSFKFGGSTITQQLVKNLYLSPSKNPVRKLKEALITWRMEKVLSKRRILELYLNVAEWGDGIFGVQAASLHYFGKPASLLSPDEACRLAVILPNPKRYKLNGNSRYVEKRAGVIYKVMVKRGVIVRDYEDAAQQAETERPLSAPEAEGQ